MERLLIRDILSDEYIGKTVTVCGWVRTKRESKGFAFLVLSDGSTQEMLQLVIPAEKKAFQQLHRCNTGSAIKAVGMLKESPAKGQKYEVEVSEVEIFGEADLERYPLQQEPIPLVQYSDYVIFLLLQFMSSSRDMALSGYILQLLQRATVKEQVSFLQSLHSILKTFRKKMMVT